LPSQNGNLEKPLGLPRPPPRPPGGMGECVVGWGACYRECYSHSNPGLEIKFELTVFEITVFEVKPSSLWMLMFRLMECKVVHNFPLSTFMFYPFYPIYILSTDPTCFLSSLALGKKQQHTVHEKCNVCKKSCILCQEKNPA